VEILPEKVIAGSCNLDANALNTIYGPPDSNDRAHRDPAFESKIDLHQLTHEAISAIKM